MVRFVVFILFVLNCSLVFAAENIGHQKSNYTPLQATLLVSDADHTQFLKDTLATATKSVMISSYSVSPKRLFEEGLGQAIISAADRGIVSTSIMKTALGFPENEYAALARVASYCAVLMWVAIGARLELKIMLLGLVPDSRKPRLKMKLPRTLFYF